MKCNWKRLVRQLRWTWLTARTRATQELTTTALLGAAFAREWEDYPWHYTETVRFITVSTLSGLYRIEVVLAKRYRQPDGKLKTQVDEAAEWTGAYNSSSHTVREVGGQREVAFHPEQSAVYFLGHYFSMKKDIV